MLKRNALFIAAALCLMATGCNSQSNKTIAQKQKVREDILEVLATEPEEPHKLPLGSKLNVHIGYKLNATETAQIWARPYKNGQKAPGYKAHKLIPVKRKNDESNLITGWFSFDKPAEIDVWFFYPGDCV